MIAKFKILGDYNMDDKFFIGYYGEYSLDDKGRMFLPAKIRAGKGKRNHGLCLTFPAKSHIIHWQSSLLV